MIKTRAEYLIEDDDKEFILRGYTFEELAGAAKDTSRDKGQKIVPR